MYGGARGIRTLDTFDRIHDFQSCAFDRSATAPILLKTAQTLAGVGAKRKSFSKQRDMIQKNMTILPVPAAQVPAKKPRIPPLSSVRRRGITGVAALGFLTLGHDMALGLLGKSGFSFMSFFECFLRYAPRSLESLRSFSGEGLYWSLILPLLSLPMTPFFLALCLIMWVIAMRAHIRHWTPLLNKCEPKLKVSQKAIWDERLQEDVKRMRETGKENPS